MASITIRHLEDDIKQRLRVRAAERGRSMEEEARDILRRAVGDADSPRDLAATIRARVAPAARVDLDVPAREPMRQPPQDGAQVYFTEVGEADLRHGVAILAAGKGRTALTKAIEGLLEKTSATAPAGALRVILRVQTRLDH